jgi:hypothetical protein
MFSLQHSIALDIRYFTPGPTLHIFYSASIIFRQGSIRAFYTLCLFTCQASSGIVISYKRALRV